MKAESASVGCKVLPICDAVSTASNGRESCDGSEKDLEKAERRRAVSRMKELVRWAAAAAAKTNRGGNKAWKVLNFRSKLALKDQLDDSSSNSGKISFGRDGSSCSTPSSVYSILSLASASKRDRSRAKNSTNLSANLQSSRCDVNVLGSSKTQEHVRTGHWITTDSDFVVLEL